MFRSPGQLSAHAPLLVFASHDRVFAVQRSDGARAWAHQLPKAERGWSDGQDASVFGPLALEIVKERVFVAQSSRLTCIEYLTGRVLGTVALPAWYARPQMLIDGNDVFVVCESRIFCFDLNGALRWEAPHDVEGLYSSAAIGFPENVRQGDFVGYK